MPKTQAEKAPTLKDILTDGFPEYRTTSGILDVPGLAKALSLSHEAVYKWLRQHRLPPKAAKNLVSFSNGKITLEMLTPFVFA